MKVQSFLTAAVLALEGVSAHPTVSHAKLHKFGLKDILSKRQYDTSNVDWSKALKDVNWCQVFPHGEGCSSGSANTETGSAPASSPVTAPVQSSKLQTSTDPSTSSTSSTTTGGGSGSCADLTKVFSKRATTEQDSYLGNSVGNIHPEANCQSSKQFSLTFVNNMGSKQTFWLWNKAGTGTTNNPNGMMIPASNVFTLEAGQKGTFSFDPNSLVGFSQACGRAPNNGNVPNCNVGEASFADGNTAGGSNGGSFYDVSMVTVTDIKNHGGSPSTIPMSISASGFSTSSDTQCNYVQATDNSPQNPPGGGACNNGPQSSSDPFHPTVTFG